ncbi:MAG TPA: SgcJ/EcaC family oxidoreductase [Chthoniobacterales bacterium]|jgi:uncharacterized protein (TIGR02246 family)|nr:SgcJ/EcaC family oxidoreductase [Chthoniobacterales bacterium]
MRSKQSVTIVGLFVLLGCLELQAQIPDAAAGGHLVLDNGVKAHAGLDQIYGRFSEGYKKLDPAAVADLYTENAAYLVPAQNLEIGRQKILDGFTKFFNSVKQRNGRLEISFRIAQRQVEQNLAYDVGIYTLTSFDDKGGSRSSQGKFIVVAQPGKDGVWRFQVDGYNDLPKPPK